MLTLTDSLTVLTGIGAKRQQFLSSRGINTIEDLIYYFPRKYLDRSRVVSIGELKIGETATVIGLVRDISTRKTSKRNLYLTTAVVFDGTGYLNCVWFGRRNLENILKPETRLALSGKAEPYRGRIQFENPEFDILEEKSIEDAINTGKIVPVYPAAGKLGTAFFRRIIRQALSRIERIPENLPLEIIEELDLMNRDIAIRQIHFPDSEQLLDAAIHRFKLEELVIFQLAIAEVRKRFSSMFPGEKITASGRLMKQYIEQTGFTPTPSQAAAIKEIIRDLNSSRPMNRLLHGEVGSGKTFVSLAAALYVVEAGYQAAFMAPTEVLAAQHYRKTRPVLGSLGVTSCLITSAVSQKEKKALLEQISSGKINIAFGTHSLIEEGVKFSNLGLVIIDEQHRFGTLQRLRLREKSSLPNMLIMSATPIPRTLALTAFGDLDVSTLLERPGGSLAKNVRTVHLNTGERDRAYRVLKRVVEQGSRAFIVVPLIEESEALDAAHLKSVLDYARKFVHADKIAVLHGKQSIDEKKATMDSFVKGDTPVLVATTVIEVGIDVADARLMIIENAERFGLSQLHQLRGRVGRKGEPSEVYVISDLPTPESRERIRVFTSVNDGFLLAEKDLELRGEGELDGTRQSGASSFRFASLTRDYEALKKAREVAFSYHQRYSSSDISVKIAIEEARRRFGQLELALKA